MVPCDYEIQSRFLHVHSDHFLVFSTSLSVSDLAIDGRTNDLCSAPDDSADMRLAFGNAPVDVISESPTLQVSVKNPFLAAPNRVPIPKPGRFVVWTIPVPSVVVTVTEFPTKVVVVVVVNYALYLDVLFFFSTRPRRGTYLRQEPVLHELRVPGGAGAGRGVEVGVFVDVGVGARSRGGTILSLFCRRYS